MSDEARSTEPGLLAEQIETSLNMLERSLADAGRAVAQVRRDVAQVTTLADVVRDLEATINRAKGLGAAASPQPPLRAVPPTTAEEPQTPPTTPPATPEAPAATAPEPAPAAEQISTPEETPAPAAQQTAPADQTVSHCLRVGVSSKTGSLDLKAVDGSVNENPAVVDVALLDYDGRQATLKLWINNQADPQGVRDALLASLRSRLGDERDADVHIDFEEAA